MGLELRSVPLESCHKQTHNVLIGHLFTERLIIFCHKSNSNLEPKAISIYAT